MPLYIAKSGDLEGCHASLLLGAIVLIGMKYEL